MVKRLCAIVIGASLMMLSGCRTNQTETAPVSRKPRGGISFDVQHCVSTGDGGDETVEILIRNGTERDIAFAHCEIDGVELPFRTPTAAFALRKFAFDGLGGKTLKRMSVTSAVAGMRWWRFYPGPNISAGTFAVFQLNFEGVSRPCKMGFKTEDGRNFTVLIPRYTSPARVIEHLAFAADGRSLTLRYSRGSTPRKVRINGKTPDFRILEAASAGRPGAVVADIQDPISEGDPVLVELEFDGGAHRFAFIRAMLGVFTVAPAGWDSDFRPLPDGERAEYGFDAAMRVYRLPFDVACDDTRAHHAGASARAVVAAGEERAKRFPNGLSGVDFCTALYPSVWNIYSQMADAVIAKPYKLHWGRNVVRFIDEEDTFLANVGCHVAPRPVVWVPERFRRLRELDGDEFSVLAWCAMMRGVRGVRIHHWLNDPSSPFDGNPRLAGAVKRFNRDLNRLRSRIERLIPIGVAEDRKSRISVLEGWSADDGVLLLFRNQRYDTGIDTHTGMRSRPFSVQPVSNYEFAYSVPKWLKPGIVVDALSGESVDCTWDGAACRISIPEIEAIRLIWIDNTAKGEVK